MRHPPLLAWKALAKRQRSIIADLDRELNDCHNEELSANRRLADAIDVLLAYAIPLEAISISHGEDLGPEVSNAIAVARAKYAAAMERWMVRR